MCDVWRCNPPSFIAFQATEWVQKKEWDGRFCVGIKEHKTATMQIATFALDAEDAAVSTLTGWNVSLWITMTTPITNDLM